MVVGRVVWLALGGVYLYEDEFCVMCREANRVTTPQRIGDKLMCPLNMRKEVWGVWHGLSPQTAIYINVDLADEQVRRRLWQTGPPYELYRKLWEKWRIAEVKTPALAAIVLASVLLSSSSFIYWLKKLVGVHKVLVMGSPSDEAIQMLNVAGMTHISDLTKMVVAAIPVYLQERYKLLVQLALQLK